MLHCVPPRSSRLWPRSELCAPVVRHSRLLQPPTPPPLATVVGMLVDAPSTMCNPITERFNLTQILLIGRGDCHFAKKGEPAPCPSRLLDRNPTALPPQSSTLRMRERAPSWWQTTRSP